MDTELNLGGLADEDLEALRLMVMGEQDRRRRLAAAFGQVIQLTEQYVIDGGDKSDIVAVVTTGRVADPVSGNEPEPESEPESEPEPETESEEG